MDKFKILRAWLLGHFAIHFLFIPLATKNVIPPRIAGLVGYIDIFIFGIRVIRLQKTKPWSAADE